MTSFGRLGLSCATSALLLALGTVGACSSNGSNSFNAAGGNGSNNTAGNAGTVTDSDGGGIVTSDAGTYEPDSTVVEDVDSYTTSCEAEVCTSDEACWETCSWGSCCVHACEGQTGSSSSAAVACCDRSGGIVPGASCG